MLAVISSPTLANRALGAESARSECGITSMIKVAYGSLYSDLDASFTCQGCLPQRCVGKNNPFCASCRMAHLCASFCDPTTGLGPVAHSKFVPCFTNLLELVLSSYLLSVTLWRWFIIRHDAVVAPSPSRVWWAQSLCLWMLIVLHGPYLLVLDFAAADPLFIGELVARCVLCMALVSCVLLHRVELRRGTSYSLVTRVGWILSTVVALARLLTRWQPAYLTYTYIPVFLVHLVLAFMALWFRSSISGDEESKIGYRTLLVDSAGAAGPDATGSSRGISKRGSLNAGDGHLKVGGYVPDFEYGSDDRDRGSASGMRYGYDDMTSPYITGGSNQAQEPLNRSGASRKGASTPVEPPGKADSLWSKLLRFKSDAPGTPTPGTPIMHHREGGEDYRPPLAQAGGAGGGDGSRYQTPQSLSGSVLLDTAQLITRDQGGDGPEPAHMTRIAPTTVNGLSFDFRSAAIIRPGSARPGVSFQLRVLDLRQPPEVNEAVVTRSWDDMEQLHHALQAFIAVLQQHATAWAPAPRILLPPLPKPRLRSGDSALSARDSDRSIRDATAWLRAVLDTDLLSRSDLVSDFLGIPQVPTRSIPSTPSRSPPASGLSRPVSAGVSGTAAPGSGTGAPFAGKAHRSNASAAISSTDWGRPRPSIGDRPVGAARMLLVDVESGSTEEATVGTIMISRDQHFDEPSAGSDEQGDIVPDLKPAPALSSAGQGSSSSSSSAAAASGHSAAGILRSVEPSPSAAGAPGKASSSSTTEWWDMQRAGRSVTVPIGVAAGGSGDYSSSGAALTAGASSSTTATAAVSGSNMAPLPASRAASVGPSTVTSSTSAENLDNDESKLDITSSVTAKPRAGGLTVYTTGHHSDYVSGMTPSPPASPVHQSIGTAAADAVVGLAPLRKRTLSDGVPASAVSPSRDSSDAARSGKLAGSSHGPRLPAPCPYGHGARPHVVITIPAWFPVKGKQDARKTPAGAKPPPPPKRGDQSTGNEDTAASDSAESGGKNKKKISGGGKEKGFIVYRVVMCVDGVQRSIEQRYRLFEELHRDLEKAYPDAVIPALPGKVFNLDKNDRKAVELRRLQLEEFLQDLAASNFRCAPQFAHWLGAVVASDDSTSKPGSTNVPVLHKHSYLDRFDLTIPQYSEHHGGAAAAASADTGSMDPQDASSTQLSTISAGTSGVNMTNAKETYVTYRVISVDRVTGHRREINRRYNEFVGLHDHVKKLICSEAVPHLPGKDVLGALADRDKMVERRRVKLEQYIQTVSRSRGNSKVFLAFIGVQPYTAQMSFSS